MFDEPLGSLDSALRESLLDQMRHIVSDLGTTSLYVTHDRGEAFAFADRLAVLVDGSVARIGSPQEVWSDPGTVTVARLIGHPNIVSDGLGSGAPCPSPLLRSVVLLVGATAVSWLRRRSQMVDTG